MLLFTAVYNSLEREGAALSKEGVKKCKGLPEAFQNARGRQPLCDSAAVIISHPKYDENKIKKGAVACESSNWSLAKALSWIIYSSNLRDANKIKIFPAFI